MHLAAKSHGRRRATCPRAGVPAGRVSRATVLVLASLACVAGSCGCGSAGRGVGVGGAGNGYPIGYSGIAPLAGQAGRDTFLVVHDFKNDDAERDRPRLSVITYQTGKTPGYRVLPVRAERDEDGIANDLEGVCVVPGSGGSAFLAVESRFVTIDGKPRFGRLWHLMVERDLSSSRPVAVRARVVTRLPAGWDEVEGLACARADDGRLIVVFGERGGDPGRGETPRLRWGTLDLTDGAATAFTPAGELPLDWLVARGLPDGWRDATRVRACADLLLDADGRTLLAVGSEDSGDNGPFRSVVYEAAAFDPAAGTFAPPATPKVLAVLDGMKVEALGPGVVTFTKPPAAERVPCRFTVATDDELFGGVWRPILPAKPESPATRE